MAARGGKSQARRKGGSNAAGLPGWAWLVLGVLLTLLVVLALPRVLGDGDSGGFLRPRPNPDAQPQPVTAEDAAVVSEPRGPAASTGKPAAAAGTGEDYDFYTLLPGQEVEMTDAQLAAAAREEAARKQRLAQQQAAQTAEPDATQPQAIDTATAAADGAVTNSPSPATPQPARQADATTTATPTSTPAPTSTTVATADTRPQTPYVLQAGSFAASGDAEAAKAKIALLGLNARVESAQINGKTMYRVRMGPYGTATELADAKSKLASGGLPAMAIKAQ